MKIAVLAGDGVGPEVVDAALLVLSALDLSVELEHASVGGLAYDQTGSPLPDATLRLAKASDAILFGAVGGWQYDTLARELRPEQAVLGLRKHLGLFANLRPATIHAPLIASSPLKPEIIDKADMLILRELTGDVYFGQPRGIRIAPDGEFVGQREGFDTMRYAEGEVRRIVRMGFDLARLRRRRLCSVDKANVLETMQLWREVSADVAKEYPDVQYSTLYVDNAAMQLVARPSQFDVLVTGNLFGDILSDIAAVLSGSLGMLPSASLNGKKQGLYEPIHGSAPDIAGQNKANPIGTILSLGMMLRYSLGQETAALRVEQAVGKVLQQGFRTADIYTPGTTQVGTKEMAQAIVKALPH